MAKMRNLTLGSTHGRLSCDILEPLPEAKCILIATDQFTNWIKIHRICDLTVATTTIVLSNGIIDHFDCPLTNLSHQGRNYMRENVAIRQDTNKTDQKLHQR